MNIYYVFGANRTPAGNECERPLKKIKVEQGDTATEADVSGLAKPSLCQNNRDRLDCMGTGYSCL